MKRFLLLWAMLPIAFLHAQSGCETAEEVGFGVTNVSSYTHRDSFVTCIDLQFRSDSLVWFTFTPNVDTTIRITTGGFEGASTANTRLSILTGSCGDLTCLYGNDNGGPGLSAQLDLEVSAGVIYYLIFDDKYSSDAFSFLIEGVFIPKEILNFSQLNLDRTGALRASVDMNGDYLDDIVSVSPDNIQIQYQVTDGSFVEENIPTTEADNPPSWSLAAGDINSDGQNDLIYGGGNGTTFMLSDGDGGFIEESPELYIFCQRSNCVDIDNDGLLDVFMCHDIDYNVAFMNQDNQSYIAGRGLGETSEGGNYGSIWIDYDNDRDLDLFLSKCRGGNQRVSINELHRNNGDGTFTEVAEEMNLADDIQTWSSAWGDYDNDGDLDVFVGASSLGDDYHRLMRNDGNTFTDVSAGSGLNLVDNTGVENITHDFNNDGYLDIFGVGSIMFINNGDMTFTPTAMPCTDGPVADLNGDGFLDIVNGYAPNEMTVFLNEGNSNNYFKLTTKGTISNPNGIGARVEIYTDSGTQIREVRSGEGYRYMSSLNVHFGIGASTTIDKVKVYWPSGIVDEIFDPAINSTLHLVEGESPSANQEFQYEEVVLYPNPTVNHIKLPSDFVTSDALVDIFDVNGSLLIRTRLNNNTVDVAGLKSGNYQLVYRNRGAIKVGKFVKY